MTCSSCGEPLLSPLERTRGVCASCHLLSPRSGNLHASEQASAFPSSRDSPGEILDSTAAPSTPLNHQSPAQDVVPERDSNDSNTSEEAGSTR